MGRIGPYEKQCNGCKVNFLARMKNQKFCKPECARKKTFASLRNCIYCKKEFLGYRVDKKVCGDELCLKSLSKSNSLSWRIKSLGVSVSQFEELRRLQNDRCVICDLPETLIHKGKLQNLSIDHCHETGKIRGLLCKLCNMGLGLFKDDKKRLKKAIQYLELSEGE